ncbi:MAG: sulfite exporter TauE/SafE family protein [Candidatus Brocadiia bacterium]
MKYRLLGLLMVLMLLAGGLAQAHDISDRQVQGITNSVQLSVWQDLIFIDYWIAIGNLEAVNYLPIIDVDKDGEITDDEKLAYLEVIRQKVANSAFSLTIDEARNLPFKQWKPGTITVDESKDAAVPIKIGLEFVLDFETLPATAGWRSAFTTHPITKAQEHNLTFFIGNVMDKKVLTKVYVNQDEWIGINWTPEDYRHCLGLSSGIYLKPYESSWAKFAFSLLDKPAGAPSPFAFNMTPVKPSSQQNLKVEGLLSGDLTFLIILGALAAAFIYGAGHALAPGHGKTLVAAYLIGSRGTVWQAILLGLIVTFTHIFTVVVAGVIALGASSYVHQAALSTYLGVVSGLIIVILGVWIFVSRAFGKGDGHHHGHDHEHEHGHDHDNEHEHTEHSHEHSLPQPITGEKIKLKHLIGLGISGGLVPCPTAIFILLLAVNFKKTVWGLVLIGAFSLGLAAVLIAIGILMVTGSSLVNRFSAGSKVIKILGIISPIIITVIGLAIVFKTFIDAGIIIINLQAMP